MVWTFSGPTLKVFNTAEGTIQSSWDFSSVTRDTRTQVRFFVEYTGSFLLSTYVFLNVVSFLQIKCVIEYPVCDNSRLPTKENQICLVVGYTSKKDSSKSSYISFCHPRTSRILHTITTKEKVIHCHQYWQFLFWCINFISALDHVHESHCSEKRPYKSVKWRSEDYVWRSRNRYTIWKPTRT